ncbi:hypothetical protein F4815DRAFT_500047 [Daldinia loculata]|nr:hypothetical protein F4815DRAFT_500047 [Daldinia loculata]
MEHPNRGKIPLTQERLMDMVFEEIESLIRAGKKDFVESNILNSPLHEYALEVARKYVGLPCKPSLDVLVSQHTPTQEQDGVPSSLEKTKIQHWHQLFDQINLERERLANSMRSDSRRIVLPENCAVRRANPILDDKRGAFPGETWEHKRVNPGPTLGPLSQFKSSLVKPLVTKVDALGITKTRSSAVEPVDVGSKTEDDVMEVEDKGERKTSS